MLLTPKTIIAVLALLAGCYSSQGSEEDGPGDATVDEGEASPPDVLSEIRPDPCSEPVQQLAWELGASHKTVVVRLDGGTLVPIAFAVGVDAHHATNEEEAQAAVAEVVRRYPWARAISPADAADAWVFYAAPTDVGYVAAVSVDTGQVVFGADIIWLGHGEVVFPAGWREPVLLPDGCASHEWFEPVSAYDVVSRSDGVTAEEVEAVLAALGRTAVPDAMRFVGYIFSAVVIAYNGDGEHGGTVEEWIVLLNGGWLE